MSIQKPEEAGNAETPATERLARRKLLQQLGWAVPAVVATTAVRARAGTPTGGTDPCEENPKLCQ